MELRIKFVNGKEAEGGVCYVHKLEGGDLRQIGEIKYGDEGDRKWILSVMTDYKPNVKVID